MDINDIIYGWDFSADIKRAIMGMMITNDIYDPSTPVLIPTETNDDVNGSQHASNGGTDFTYREATGEDIRCATTIGVYDYFSTMSQGTYTGHYYNGDGKHFRAVVIDPPAYAVEENI